MIQYGNREGQYFSPGHFVELTRLAEDLATILPDATSWKIWYDNYQDFHHLAFSVGGIEYNVRYYRVFAVSKDMDSPNNVSGVAKVLGWHRDSVVDFFREGDHLSW